MNAGRITLLGPQRLLPTLAPTLASLDAASGRIATITAGWQEREIDDTELDAHLGGRSHNLRLYERAERVFHSDPDLARAHHERQARLRELQDLYNLQLDHCMAAAYELLSRTGRSVELESERTAAIETLRALDTRHLESARRIHAEYEAAAHPHERDAVRRERQEITAILGDSVAVTITGGHVAVLANRLRLFDLQPLLADKLVVAWSAGAMACCERIVLFHDQPAHGMGNAEVLDLGIGLCAGIVPLPHARLRLRLDRPDRVALFARRFAPDACVPMNEGARLDLRKGRWVPCEATEQATPGTLSRLQPDGTLGTLEAA